MTTPQGGARAQPGRAQRTVAHFIRALRQHALRVGGGCVALLMLASGAHAQDPALTQGLQWLHSQVQTDGTLAGSSPNAHTEQRHCEAATTLLRLSPASSAPLAALLNAPPSATPADTITQTIACQQWLTQPNGPPPRDNELTQRRKAAGGYSAYRGEPSANPLDTAWALWSQWTQWSAAEQDQTLQWLHSRQNADGSFASAGQTLLATSTALRGLTLAAPRSDRAAAMANAASAYLLTQMDSQGRWANDMASTARTFEALHPYSGADPSIAQRVAIHLRAQQQPDGSWGQDAYVTALALRALALTAQPPQSPVQASVTARFVDARSGLGVPGVQLSAATPDGPSASSDGQGRVTLRGLSAGEQTLQARADGYQTLQISVSPQAGQLLDLGTLPLIPPSNANTATINGTARDRTTGAPLAGVQVQIEGQAGAQAITQSDGTYLIAAAMPGALTLRASKGGYTSASAQASVQAGQTLNFSPRLTATQSSGGTPGDCLIQGQITEAATGQALAGVDVRLSGANTQSTTTDAQGQYRLAGLASGLSGLSLSLAGHDSVAVQVQLICAPMRATVLEVSARLYGTGQSPANANTSALSGLVLDAGTGQPIVGAHVQLTASDASAPLSTSATTGSDGRFAFAGLSGASVQLQTRAAGYEGQDGTYLLLPLQSLDLGQIRLRAPKVVQLLPDLKVLSVLRHTALTDAQSLRLSGQVQVQVGNVGTLSSPADVPVLAFSDLNGNGRYDPDVDITLGQGSIAPSLAPRQTHTFALTVAGSLPFRDAPIHLLIDPQGQLPELSKSNNLRSSAQDVLYLPVARAFKPKLKWHWSGSNNYPGYNQVMIAPVVGPFLDTNGDGVVDARDAPCVIFTTFAGSAYGSSGVIRVLNGSTGRELMSIFDSIDGVAGIGGLALADLDRDGMPELIGVTSNNKVIAFRNDGSRFWVSNSINSAPGWGIWAAPSIADLDGDGKPEIIVQKSVLNADGSLKWRASGANFGGGYGNLSMISVSIASDLFGIGQQNVIIGGSVYTAAGNLLWEAVDGFSGVADFERSGQPSIVVTGNGYISLYSRDGLLKWRVVIPGGGYGGPPTIADADGSGIPSIGVASATAYTVFRADGSILWSRSAQDVSSTITGSTFFDFNGDGSAEALYADEVSMRGFQGATGETLWSIQNPSGTALEYPLVVDVDRDGRSDIVFVSNNYYFPGVNGVRVFQDENNAWVPTRSIWNQHAYSITNINDDLSVPRNPVPSWRAHNTFRLNQRTDGDARAIADLSVGYLRVQDGGATGPTSLVVRVGNAGSYKVPAATPVAVYSQDPALGQPPASALLGVGTLPTELASGQYHDLTVVLQGPLAQAGPTGRIWIVADDDGSGNHRLPDFDPANNTHTGDLAQIARQLSMRVQTDKASYTETDLAQFTVTVINEGSYAQNAQARLSVWDAQGRRVDELPLPAALSVAPAASQAQAQYWASAGVLAGAYVLRAELVTDAGLVYASASTPFNIQTGQSQATGASISADRQRYSAAHTIHIDARVRNLTGNTVLYTLRAISELLDEQQHVAYQQTEAIAQLAPGVQRQFSYAAPAAALAPGRYALRLRVLDEADTVRASSTSGFVVQGTDTSGIGLQGQLSAQPDTAPVGDTITLQLSLLNQGNAPIEGASVHIRVIEPASGQLLGQWSQSALALALGESRTLRWNWVAAGPSGTALIASATLQLNGQDLPLAQTRLSLQGAPAPALSARIAANPTAVPLGQPVQLSYSVTNLGSQPTQPTLSVSISAADDTTVLAQWRSTPSLAAQGSHAVNVAWSPPGPAGRSYLATLSAQSTGPQGAILTQVLGSASFSVSAPSLAFGASAAAAPARLLVLVNCNAVDDTNAADPQCAALKAQRLGAWLAAQGHNARVVSSRTEFEQLMRCGQYSAYWLSGGAHGLGSQAVQALRQALLRGHSLLLDGQQTRQDAPVHALAGVQWLGQGTGANAQMDIAGLSLPTQGPPVRYEALALTRVQGRWSESGDPAVFTHATGPGQAVVFGTSLSRLIEPGPGAQALATLMTATLQYLAPAPGVALTGAPLTLGAALNNDGPQPVLVTVQTTLPAHLRYLSAQPAPQGAGPDAQGVLTWRLTLGALERRTLTLQLSPQQAGPLSLSLDVQAAPGADAPTQYRTQIEHRLSVGDAAAAAPAAVQALAALVPTGDEAPLQAARQTAAQALSLTQQGRAAQALPLWLQAAASLALRTDADTDASAQGAATALALAVQAASQAHCTAQGCLSGELEFSVNGQRTREVLLGQTVVGQRTVRNQCPAQIKDLPVTSAWVNRRSAQEVLTLWDNLTLPAQQSNQRANGWQSLGQENDWIDIALSAQWAGQTLQLDQQSVQIMGATSGAPYTPQLSGSVSVNPASARAASNIAISHSLRNSAAVQAKDVPLTLRITRAASAAGAAPVYENTWRVTLNPGESTSANTTWFVQGAAGEALRIELSASVAGQSLPLGWASFTIEP